MYRRLTAVLAATGLAVLGVGAVPAHADSGGGLPVGSVSMDAFPGPLKLDAMDGITAGPDGNLWFSSESSSYTSNYYFWGITEASSDGTVVATYPTTYEPADVIVGPGGNLWFDFADGNGQYDALGEMTPAGVETDFPIPVASGDIINGLTEGPDGNLWFTVSNGNTNGSIDSMTPQGVVTQYPMPIPFVGNDFDITAGPDGNVWFLGETDDYSNDTYVGSITPTGTIATYALPQGDRDPGGITTGPDGNIWFAERGLIGNITPSGTESLFPMPADMLYPTQIVSGPDGDLYVNANLEDQDSAVFAVTTSGSVARYPVLQDYDDLPRGLTVGPDGQIWFVALSALASLGKVTITDPYTADVTVSTSDGSSVYGQPATATVTVAGTGEFPPDPTGTVTFVVNDIPQAPVPLVDGTASLDLSMFPATPLGMTLSATYNGDSNYGAESSILPYYSLTADPTTTVLTSSANPSASGQDVVETATVTPNAPGGGTPTGVVTFYVNNTSQNVTLQNGVATLDLPSLTAGTYSITASYAPTQNSLTFYDYGSSSASLTQTVNQSSRPTATATTLAVSPNGSAVEGSAVTLTATESPATSGSVQFYDGTATLGSPVAVSAGVATYATSALAVGSHSLSAVFTPSSNTYVGSTSATVTYQITVPPLAIDQTISQNGTGKVTTSPFSTAGPRLLVAFTSSDGPGTKQTTTVSGAGLTWTLVQRSNSKGGTAEIWTALAAGPLTNATITSTPKTNGYDQSLTVVAFTGAGGIGASTTADKAKGAPSISLATTVAGSWVFGVGEDYSNAVARTLGTGQNLINQWVDTTPGEAFWVQDQSGTTPVAGTTVTIGDTAPTADIWNMAAVEILPATS